MSIATKPGCRFCRHPAHRGDCGVDDCGCVRYVPVDLAARKLWQRQWIVQASFLVRRGWTPPGEVRVRALTASGAAFKGIREAKRLAVAPRARVAQVRVTLIAVRGGRTRGQDASV